MISRRTRTLQSPKYLQKKRKKTLVTVVLAIVCVLVCITALILVLWLPFFQIKKVMFEKSGTLPALELEQRALSAIQGTYFYLIPRSFVFLYSKKAIETEVMSAYKMIDSMRISRKDFSTLEVSIIERIPDAVVCEGFREEGETDDCFFVDKDGYVYAESPDFSDGVYSRYYTNSDSDKLVLGDNFIEPARFKELQNFIKGARANSITTLGILIGDSGSYELYVKNRDQSTAVIYFDDRTPFDKTISNLVAFWDNAMTKKIGTTTASNFNYINLRFGNNIFYSFK